MTYSFEPIGVVRSCFAEKFAIPRQPQLAPAARGVIELFSPYDQPAAVAELEQVSHLWVIFVFHAAQHGEQHLRVRPPRLGGNRRVGVFASRATHRPNPIGQSVVKLDAVTPGRLFISGLDMLDGTPVLDIKPYVPYADVVNGAYNRLADSAPTLLAVSWTPSALSPAHMHTQRLQQPVIELVEQCLAQDPKPAYQRPSPDREYGVRFWDINVRWHYPNADSIRVLEMEQLHD